MERPRELFKVSFIILGVKKGYMEMTKRIYLETLKSALGRSISRNCNFLEAFFPGAFFLGTLLKTVLLFLFFSKKKKKI